MNCLTEVLGMGLKGNGTIPAVYSARIQLAKHAGMQIMELVKNNIRPRDIMTEDAIRNALTVDMALDVLPTVCCIFRQSLMKSEWILISAMQMKSVRRLRTCVIWHRQDIHISKTQRSRRRLRSYE